jgi:hypothetical protein
MATVVKLNKSPYVVETGKGEIELTKGMYLAMQKRRLEKKTV